MSLKVERGKMMNYEMNLPHCITYHMKSNQVIVVPSHAIHKIKDNKQIKWAHAMNIDPGNC
jgi:hypothetical protein